MSPARPAVRALFADRARVLLAGALLLGGLRDPYLFALGGAAVWALVWLARPGLGPAAAWLPWLGWAALSAAASAQPLAALPTLARGSAALGFFSLAAAWPARERDLWLKALLALAVVLGAAALVTGAGLGFGPSMIGLLRPYYNYTAFALAAAAAAGTAWGLHPRGPRGAWRTAAFLVAAFCVVCILLARSRGALLGLGVAVAIWSARRWGARAALGWLAAAVVAGAALQTGIVPSSIRDALEKRSRRYAEARPLIWRAAAGIASERPWLGEGPGSFAGGFRRRPVEAKQGAARWGFGTEYAHSEPLQAAAETGWAGLALWLLGLGATLAALAGPASGEPAREAAAAALAAMGCQLAVDNMLQMPGLAFLFFSAAAVSKARPAGPRWPRAAALAGAALALGAWIPRSLASGDPARAAVLFPAEPSPREDLAYRAMAEGRLAEADALWVAAAERAPFDAVYPWRRAQIAAARKRWPEAAAHAGGALALEPNFPRARILRAEALARLGRRAAARAELAEARRLEELGRDRVPSSKYDEVVTAFDVAGFARVSALARGR